MSIINLDDERKKRRGELIGSVPCTVFLSHMSHQLEAANAVSGGDPLVMYCNFCGLRTDKDEERLNEVCQGNEIYKKEHELS